MFWCYNFSSHNWLYVDFLFLCLSSSPVHWWEGWCQSLSEWPRKWSHRPSMLPQLGVGRVGGVHEPADVLALPASDSGTHSTCVCGVCVRFCAPHACVSLIPASPVQEWQHWIQASSTRDGQWGRGWEWHDSAHPCIPHLSTDALR